MAEQPWYKQINIREEVVIIFEFMLSIFFIGLFYLFVMGIAVAINLIMYHYKGSGVFSMEVISHWEKLKAFIMYGDMLLVALFVFFATLIGVKKIFNFGINHFFHWESKK